MMKEKLYLVLFLVILFFPNVSAIIINEVEVNPLIDTNEWVELYNDGENDLDISGWEIWEGIYGSQGPKLILSIPEETIISKDGFYIVEWSQSKLNNGGDFVILYDSEENEIDRTETLDETERSSKTWNYCDEWIFIISSKNSENNCPSEEEPEEETPEEPPEEKDEDERTTKEKKVVEEYQEIAEIREEETGPIKLKMINLNPKVIKSENDNEKLNNNYALYGFVFFSVLIIVLFVLRRNKYKNEFR